MTAEREVSPETNNKGEQREDVSDDTSELEHQIIQQVEYYFGDSNLTRDKFLREQTKLDDGWVPLDNLLKFKRLAKLSKDTVIIADALKKSTLGLLEVSEDKKKVRRNPEMPVPEMNEDRRKDISGRSVYAKGFPKDSILDDLLKFFKEQGETDTVIMRRYLDKLTKTKLFKGSVFATFKSKEDAEKFVANKELKYGGSNTPLLIMRQEEYLKKRQEEYQERLEKKNKKSKEKEANRKDKESLKLPTGSVLHITQESEELKREDLDAAFTALGAEIAFIDFKVGDKEGWVRLYKENQAKEVFEKITDGKIKIGEAEVAVKLLEGEEETKYLEKTVEEIMKRRKNQRSNQYKNKGRGKFNRKRKQDNDGDAPPAKVKADN